MGSEEAETMRLPGIWETLYPAKHKRLKMEAKGCVEEMVKIRELHL
jgi:hypothetical protein